MEKERAGSAVFGTMLVLAGIVFLVTNLRFELTMKELWPIFPLSFGIAMYIEFAHDRRNRGLLMPATIITVSGALFLYCAIRGWSYMAQLWPVLLLGIAGGFFLTFLLGRHRRGLLVPAGIFAAVGLLFLIEDSSWGGLWPVALIVAGAALVFSRPRKP